MGLLFLSYVLIFRKGRREKFLGVGSVNRAAPPRPCSPQLNIPKQPQYLHGAYDPRAYFEGMVYTCHHPRRHFCVFFLPSFLWWSITRRESTSVAILCLYLIGSPSFQQISLDERFSESKSHLTAVSRPRGRLFRAFRPYAVVGIGPMTMGFEPIPI